MAKRFPRGHDFSPSSWRDLRLCPKRAYYKKVERLPDPPGPEARVGTLVHSVLEACGSARIAGELPREDPAVDVELVERAQPLFERDDTTWVRARVVEVLTTAAPVDFARVVLAEEVFSDVPAPGGMRAGGIVDRVDAWTDDAGGKHVEVYDYKTGYVPSAEELEDDPQTVVYHAWARQRFPGARAVVVFWWPEHGIKHAVPYDARRVDEWLERASQDVLSFRAGGYDARLGPHCAHCPFRDRCKEYRDHVSKPARVHPWEGLDTAQLVALRCQIATDKTMLEAALSEIDALLLPRVDGGGRYEDEQHVAFVRRDSMTSYGGEVVAALARRSGVPVEQVVAEVCKVGVNLVKGFLERHPECRGVARSHELPGMKQPYLRVKPRSGLF